MRLSFLHSIQAPDEEIERALNLALEAGYRYIIDDSFILLKR